MGTKHTPKKLKDKIISKIIDDGLTVKEASKLFSIPQSRMYKWLEDIPTKDEKIDLKKYMKLKRENIELYELVGKMSKLVHEEQKKRAD